MRALLLGSLLAAALVTGAEARQAAEEVRAEALAGFERVDAFTNFGRLHSFTALDEQTLIVWATAHEPYLIGLKYPSHDLKWAEVVGVTQLGSRVHKFDAVLVRGFRYPIGEIYKLSRDEAKELRRSWAE